MEGGQASLVQHSDSVRKPNSTRKRTTVDSVVGKTKRRKTVKSTWSNEDIANVITLVEKNKVLYDTGDGNYHKEKDKRIDVWNDIAIELKLNKTGNTICSFMVFILARHVKAGYVYLSIAWTFR